MIPETKILDSAPNKRSFRAHNEVIESAKLVQRELLRQQYNAGPQNSGSMFLVCSCAGSALIRALHQLNH